MLSKNPNPTIAQSHHARQNLKRSLAFGVIRAHTAAITPSMVSRLEVSILVGGVIISLVIIF